MADLFDVFDVIDQPDPIRQSIKETVDGVLWLETMQNKQANGLGMFSSSQSSSILSPGNHPRCMICTLPLGTCEHSPDWIQHKQEMDYLNENPISDLDLELESTLGLISNDDYYQTDDNNISSLNEPLALEGMMWQPLEQQALDKIGGDDIALYSPGDRIWHSSISLSDYLIVYGGLKSADAALLQPLKGIIISSSTSNGIIQPLYDLLAYNLHLQTWQVITIDENENDPQPGGRYGHSAAAIDHHRFVLFGGRGPGGRILSDLWLCDPLASSSSQIWVRLRVDGPKPAPRYFTAMSPDRTPHPALLQGNTTHSTDSTVARVVLFGGTNGLENFGDLWLLIRHPDESYHGGDNHTHNNQHEQTENVHNLIESGVNVEVKWDWRWERIVAVGLPPCPRYGHSLVLLPQRNNSSNSSSTSYNANTNNYNSSSSSSSSVNNLVFSQLLVLGGCHVSPSSEEAVGSDTSSSEAAHLLSAASALQQAYANEGLSAALHTEQLSILLQQSGSSPTLLAGSASSASQLGEETAAAESQQGVLRKALSLAGELSRSLALKEKDSRFAEQQLVDMWKSQKAAKRLQLKRAKHCLPQLDLHMLLLPMPNESTGNQQSSSSSSLLSRWQPMEGPTAFPRVTGHPNSRCNPGPPCRMHFGSVVLPDGPDKAAKVIVLGGAWPTSLTLTPVDNHDSHTAHKSNKSHNKTYNKSNQAAVEPKVWVLDLGSLEWTSPSPTGGLAYRTAALHAAKGDLARCRLALEDSLRLARSLGHVSGDDTKEVALARVLLSVAQWRFETLQASLHVSHSPSPILGHGLSTLGIMAPRLLLTGGLSPLNTIIRLPAKDPSNHDEIDNNECRVLSLEHEHVRFKRERLQAAAMLERRRQHEEQILNMSSLISLHAIREAARIEAENLLRERQQMSKADWLSSIPPLSQPLQPVVKAAGVDSISITWTDESIRAKNNLRQMNRRASTTRRVSMNNNSNKQTKSVLVQEGPEIAYMLWVRGAATKPFLPGDRVAVAAEQSASPRRILTKSKVNKEEERRRMAMMRDLRFDDGRVKRYTGTILRSK